MRTNTTHKSRHKSRIYTLSSWATHHRTSSSSWTEKIAGAHPLEKINEYLWHKAILVEQSVNSLLFPSFLVTWSVERCRIHLKIQQHDRQHLPHIFQHIFRYCLFQDGFFYYIFFCILFIIPLCFFKNPCFTFICFSGLQVIFPEYLQEKFVQSALSYIMCNGEGEYVCHNNQCICQCAEEYPQCNCPITDIQIMENTLLGMYESWAASYKDFESSGKLEYPSKYDKNHQISCPCI